jgi:hypothetical protein
MPRELAQQDLNLAYGGPVTFSEGLAGKGEQEKAAEYNTLVRSGFSDAQIKAAADAVFGVQSADNWSYLTNLAGKIAPQGGLAATTANTSASIHSRKADFFGLVLLIVAG